MENPNNSQNDTPDAPDKEMMEQIRRKRLEKLQGSASAKSEQSTDAIMTDPPAVSTQAHSPPPAEPAAKHKITITNKDMQSGAQPDNPFLTLGAQPTNGGSSPSIRISRADSPAKRAREDSESVTASPPPPRKSVSATKEETLEAFESRVLGNVFRITLDEDLSDQPGNQLIYLPGIREELEEAGEPIRLSMERLDLSLVEAIAYIPDDISVLDYLLPCWKRTTRALKGARGHSGTGKDAILKEARRLCMSYIMFAVTMPEFYGRRPNPATDSLTPYFLLDSEDERGICLDFLTEAVGRLDEYGLIKSMLLQAVAGLSYELSSMTMNDNYKPYVQALRSMARFPALVTAIAEDQLFLMAVSAPGIEKHTLLGPFFRISPLQAEVTKVYFAGPKTMNRDHVRTSQNALRLTLKAHQKDLLEIINAFVRASTSAKDRTLDWFAYIVNSNHKRRAMQVDEREVSTDGFMMNVAVILDELCEPFMDAGFTKISKIDVDYLRRSPRINIKYETKLNADQTASDKFYATTLDGTSNFISEVFFLNLASHHYGSEAANTKLKNLEKEIKHFQRQLILLEAERPKLASNPVHSAQLELQIKRYIDVLDKALSLKFAIEGVLFDDLMQARSLQFMRYVIVFMMRVASGSDYAPGKTVQLPLPAAQPEAFINLPEYVLDDIVSNFNFIFRFVPQVIISTQADELIVLCITFLRNSEYIKNPYLKSGLVSLLFHGTWPVYHRQKGVLGDALTGEKFANDHLLHALMKFYIEAESTGTHGQFYEKFNIRYEIFQVIKCIWSNDIYKQRLTQESRVNTDFFVRFVNLLLNDATYVLDESLTKFPKIHDLQVALANPSALTEEERATKEEELATAENQAQSYMQLANETVAMMKLFTAALSESFTMPEIVQRLADMMDYNLDTLCAPRSRDLKVQDPLKYHFNPKTLLAEFVDIYLNLGGSGRFIEAVARDGRSYKPANFDHATRIMKRFSLKSGEELVAWQSLIDKFKRAKEIDDQAEEDLGEIPDDFLDPLMFSLMEDPVILPMSKQTIDRSTIRSHLLSDPTDPFNRQPMSIEDVIPDTDLLERIRIFKEERRVIAKKLIESKINSNE